MHLDRRAADHDGISATARRFDETIYSSQHQLEMVHRELSVEVGPNAVEVLMHLDYAIRAAESARRAWRRLYVGDRQGMNGGTPHHP